MKKTNTFKTLALLGFTVLLGACNKQNLVPVNSSERYASTTNEVNIIGSGTNQTNQGCSLSQGYWLASPVAEWPANGVTVAGYNYTEAEAKAIWNATNKRGLADSKKAFTQLVAIKLSSATITANATVWANVAIAENYLSTLNKLSPVYLPTGNSSASAAAGAIGNWINANHCD
jgi:hypothetical protein